MISNDLHISQKSYQLLKKRYNYEGSELRNAQKRMLEMLSFLDKICRENNITYFIAFGTLLGAVRHGGFIPWDDDMDVYIDGRKLKKLRKIINSSHYPYVVQDYTIDKGFVRYYNVLRDTKSEYIKDEFQHNQRKYKGVQIDLFPYEFGAIEKGISFIGKTYGLNEKKFLGRKPILTFLTFYITRNFFIPVLKFLSKFTSNDKISLGYETGQVGYNYLVSDIFPLKTIQFEDLIVPCPSNPEAILKKDYGILYMNLPDEEQRNQHDVKNIIFYE